jgi:hypothetical protein
LFGVSLLSLLAEGQKKFFIRIRLVCKAKRSVGSVTTSVPFYRCHTFGRGFGDVPNLQPMAALIRDAGNGCNDAVAVRGVVSEDMSEKGPPDIGRAVL